MERGADALLAALHGGGAPGCVQGHRLAAFDHHTILKGHITVRTMSSKSPRRGALRLTSGPTVAYLILTVRQLLFGERPDSEVNPHGLLLSSAGTLQTTASIMNFSSLGGAVRVERGGGTDPPAHSVKPQALRYLPGCAGRSTIHLLRLQTLAEPRSRTRTRRRRLHQVRSATRQTNKRVSFCKTITSNGASTFRSRNLRRPDR